MHVPEAVLRPSSRQHVSKDQASRKVDPIASGCIILAVGNHVGVAASKSVAVS